MCQIGAMTEFDIVTLSQDGDFDFKTITVFLFSKFDREPFFFRDRNQMIFLHSCLSRDIKFAQRNTIFPLKTFDVMEPSKLWLSFTPHGAMKKIRTPQQTQQMK